MDALPHRMGIEEWEALRNEDLEYHSDEWRNYNDKKHQILLTINVITIVLLKLSTTLNNILEAEPGATMLFNVADNLGQCGQHKY